MPADDAVAQRVHALVGVAAGIAVRVAEQGRRAEVGVQQHVGAVDLLGLLLDGDVVEVRMRPAVVADHRARQRARLLDELGVGLRLLGDQEEGRGHLVARQHGQDGLRVAGLRPVVEGQRHQALGRQRGDVALEAARAMQFLLGLLHPLPQPHQVRVARRLDMVVRVRRAGRGRRRRRRCSSIVRARRSRARNQRREHRARARQGGRGTPSRRGIRDQGKSLSAHRARGVV